MDIESIRPVLVLLVSLVGAVLILVFRKDPNVREGCSLTAAVLKCLLVVSMVPAVLAGKTYTFTVLTFLPGVSLSLRVDALGLIFALTASALWILNTIYSIGYMRAHHERKQTRFYTCFALTLSATMGVAFSANLVTMYLFYEILTFVTYPLVAHNETKVAYTGANKYFFYLLGTSTAFLLPAIILTYSLSGNGDFNPAGIFPAETNALLLTFMFFLFLFGIGKAAVMPVHAWLPAAMVAPTPVSALLHAVAVVNTGVFCVLRVMFHVFGVDLMRALNLGVFVAGLASVTILTASCIALTRNNLKERLAFSTISQLSYIVLGGALLTSSGMAGGVLHIANHAFAKITLFFCAGAIYVATNKTQISELDGIGRKMPWTMTAFAIGTLTMIGIPPSGGFVSKWYLAIGSVEADKLVILFVLFSSTLLNAAYFVPIVYRAFFKAPSGEEVHGVTHGLAFAAAGDKDGGGGSTQSTQEASYFIIVPLMMTAIISLILGMFPDILLGLVRQVTG
ncbi:MAG: monovalent cation/H+ antiporter subunit D family protein [Nitrospira sp.]|nr:monovalent cation/H+ antiporter subunit D family protein [Candidatus Manganitrophaceae bacterium]HIL34254.1 monovalent cation/H+ antiporter subunit D family protein [Candidatus Manganitrophaceae bacterium]